MKRMPDSGDGFPWGRVLLKAALTALLIVAVLISIGLVVGAVIDWWNVFTVSLL